MRCFCLRFSKHWTGMSPAGPIFFAAETLQPKPSEAIGLALLEKADVTLQNELGQTILFEAQLRSAEYTQTLLSKFPINIAARCVRQVPVKRSSLTGAMTWCRLQGLPGTHSCGRGPAARD